MKARSPHRPAETPLTPRAGASADAGAGSGTRMRAALLTFATATFLTGATVGATAASASPASLRHALASFAGGAESAGLLEVVEIDGEPLPKGRVLADEVECNQFQDAEMFLANQGKKGPQVGSELVLRLQVVVTGAEITLTMVPALS